MHTMSYGCRHWQRSWFFMLLQSLTLLNGCLTHLFYGHRDKELQLLNIGSESELREPEFHKNRINNPKRF